MHSRADAQTFQRDQHDHGSCPRGDARGRRAEPVAGIPPVDDPVPRENGHQSIRCPGPRKIRP